MLRVEPLLILLTKVDKEVFIPSRTPRETLYALRDGLNYAEEHKVENYHDLKSKCKLKEKRDGIEVTSRRQIHFEDPIVQLAKSQHLVVEAAYALLDVIGAAIHHKAPSMEFPNAKVEGDALVRLEKWSAQNDYKITQSKPHIKIERETINAAQDGGPE
jgi:hypothetical protein